MLFHVESMFYILQNEQDAGVKRFYTIVHVFMAILGCCAEGPF